MKQIHLYKTLLGIIKQGLAYAAPNFTRLVYAIVLLVVFASCDRDELLDIQPYGVSIPQTVDDFELLMNQRSGSTYSSSAGWTDSYTVDRMMTDDIKIPDDRLQDYVTQDVTKYYDAITWNETFGELEEIDNAWLYLYNNIQMAHLIIEEVGSPDVSGSENEKQKIIAECKVQRAYAYFSLVNLHSKQYNESSASTDLGVPIRSNATMSGSTPRQSVKAVYDVILQDLKEALESNALKEYPTNKNWRATQAAAYGLSARVNLQMGNFETALNDATDALNLYSSILDYNALGSAIPYNFNNEEVILLKNFTEFYMPSSTVFVSDELYSMYTSNDLRLFFRFKDDPTTGERYFLSEPARYQPEISYTGVSVPEMYLIRAECYARDEQVANAMTDINLVREMRYRNEPDTTIDKSYVDYDATGIGSINMDRYNTTERFLSASTWQEALALAKQERRRELADRGTRLFDLKRYNAYDNANITLTRIIDGEVAATLEPNSNRWIVPIARKTISLAPEIEQSPR